MPLVFAEIGSAIFEAFDAIGISASVVSAIGTIIEYAAIAELLNAAQRALAPSKKSGIGQGLLINYASTEASIRVVYGTVKCGGMRAVRPC